MDTYETNYTIINQLLKQVRNHFATAKYAETEEVAKSLARLDATFKETISERATVTRPHTQRMNNMRKVEGNRFFNTNKYNKTNPSTQVNRERENWRDRKDKDTIPIHVNGSVILPDLTRPPPVIINKTPLIVSNLDLSNNNYSPQNKDRKMNVLQRSEFVQDLCYDVEGGDDSVCVEGERIVSPRVKPTIFSKLISVLIDSGSDVHFGAIICGIKSDVGTF